MKKDMNWGKTAHGLVMEEEASIKAFIKNELEKTKQYTKEYTERIIQKIVDNCKYFFFKMKRKMLDKPYYVRYNNTGVKKKDLQAF